MLTSVFLIFELGTTMKPAIQPELNVIVHEVLSTVFYRGRKQHQPLLLLC